MFKGGCGMASTGTLCISIIILIIVIILIVMVCYNYNQTQNTQTTQPYIQRPGLAAAAAYKYKNNFAKGRRRAKEKFATASCAGKPDNSPCDRYGHGNSYCMGGICDMTPGDVF